MKYKSYDLFMTYKKAHIDKLISTCALNYFVYFKIISLNKETTSFPALSL